MRRSPSGPITWTARTRSSRSVPATAQPSRTSATKATSAPASVSVWATSRVESFVVKMTARLPGRTPKSRTYRATAPASITPGRSSSAKAIGRSCAPVARITRPARTCHKVSRSGPRSCTTAYPSSYRPSAVALVRIVTPTGAPLASRGSRSTKRTRSPRPTASSTAGSQPSPLPTTKASTWAWRCTLGFVLGASSGRTPTPDRPLAIRSSTRLTIVAATIGSNHGSETSTNALDSSTPAETIPRGRPRIGERHTTSTPFASSALASVSPSNPVSSRPSNVNPIGRDRSIHVPPSGSRRPVTPAAPRRGDTSRRTGGSPCPAQR